MGNDLTGKAVRRHVTGPTRKIVADKMADLERERDRTRGRGAARPRRVSVAEFSTEWLEIVEAQRSPGTWITYSSVVRNYLLGTSFAQQPVGRVTIRDVDAWIIDVARSAGGMNAAKARRTISAMFGVAMARGLVGSNPVSGSVVPHSVAAELVPLTPGEIALILEAAKGTPVPGRWGLALACGLRQGECLGIRRDLDVDFIEGTVTIAGKTQRLPWRHGCTTDRRGFVCGLPARYCPERHAGGIKWHPYTKNRQAKRVVEVPAQVMEQLALQMDRQDAAIAAAGDRWNNPHRLLFTGPLGQPIGPEADNRAWHALLGRAGVRQVKLHGARHSTATALLGLADPRVVVEVMGWSSGAMLQRYQHPGRQARREAAEALASRLWG